MYKIDIQNYLHTNQLPVTCYSYQQHLLGYHGHLLILVYHYCPNKESKRIMSLPQVKIHLSLYPRGEKTANFKLSCPDQLQHHIYWKNQ